MHYCMAYGALVLVKVLAGEADNLTVSIFLGGYCNGFLYLGCCLSHSSIPPFSNKIGEAVRVTVSPGLQGAITLYPSREYFSLNNICRCPFECLYGTLVDCLCTPGRTGCCAVVINVEYFVECIDANCSHAVGDGD